MRILHIITRMILGGAQENTLLSVLGQRERGHTVRLLTGPTTGPEGTLVPLAHARGADVVEEPALLRAIRPVSDVQAAARIRRHIRLFAPDVVHTHSTKAGVVGRWAAWAERVPAIVHTIHGLPFHPYLPWWKRAPFVLAERWAARRCHRLISVADAMTRQARAAGVGRPDQYVTVYSGMEIEPFLRDDRDRDALRVRYGLAPDDVVVAKVARLFELKGHDDLFQAAVRLLPRHPRLRFFLIGDGAWRERLEREAERLGIRERVVFAGLVPREDLPDALTTADLVVHCSLREGLARVLPQALLSGKPTVSYDVDGAREVIRPGETGFLVPARDIDALTGAIAEILDHPAGATALAAAGTALCRERFDWQAMVDRLLALYTELLPGDPA